MGSSCRRDPPAPDPVLLPATASAYALTNSDFSKNDDVEISRACNSFFKSPTFIVLAVFKASLYFSSRDDDDEEDDDPPLLPVLDDDDDEEAAFGSFAFGSFAFGSFAFLPSVRACFKASANSLFSNILLVGTP